MSKYSSHTQPRRTAQRVNQAPPSSTLPRPSSEDFDRVFLSNNSSTRPHSYSTMPHPQTGEGSPLTSKILTTASLTGSTKDLRLLLQDALVLSEKLDSVSSEIGKGGVHDYHTLTGRGSTSSLPPSASHTSLPPSGSHSSLPPSGSRSSLPPNASLSSLSSVGSTDSGVNRMGNGAPQHYETSLAAAIATPVRKRHPMASQNGTHSPPLTTTMNNRNNSPLLHNHSSSDYAVPRSPARSVSQKKDSPDNVDVGLDCIAQLEELEKELHSFTPAAYPQKEGSVLGRDEAESHYEVSPDYELTKKPVPPSQRVGGRPSVADFVDELTEVEDQVRREPGDRHGSRERGLTASTATRELDELMANLSKFEPASGKGDYSQAHREGQKTKSAMDNLNSMLGSLDEDMTKRHGVNTAPKGVCAACNKPILTKVINALGCQWHKEHFTCAQCDIELGSTTYYESNGRPYCEKDYHELFAPRCAYCNGPVLERVLRALDKTWHKEHFFCTLCGKDFGPEGFHEKDGKAFCRECYYEKFAPRCKRCEKAIMEGFITALSSQWHPECFSCKVCGVTFPRGNYFEHEGEPHCEIHYHASRGTLCASCQKPVTGKCITAMGKKWHPEHFTCAFCLKLLNKGTFKEHRHNPYCQPCYIKLFG